MAIDPQLWGNMPGLGRAPLAAAPVSPAVSQPMQDIARRLIMATGNDRTRPGDMPIGQLVRDPATLTQAQQINELEALGGFPHQGPSMIGKAVGRAAGMLPALGGVSTLGLSAVMGGMGEAGVEQQQRRVANALTQDIAQAYERGSQARDQRDIEPSRGFFDAYEAGRQAARGYQPEREQRGGGDTRSRGNQSRDTQHSIAI